MRCTASAVLLLLTAFLGSCSEDQTSPAEDQSPTKEEIVESNAQAVMSAAIAFSVGNEGVFPADVDSDENLDGNTLLTLLPGGEYLLNPYTGHRTEPRDGLASSSGQTGYTRSTPPEINVRNIAIVNGIGSNVEIVRLNNLELLNAQTMEVSRTVLQALEDFAVQNSMVYPMNVAHLASFNGHTSELLWHPFWGFEGNPMDGPAGVFGAVGYEPVVALSFVVGYRVTASLAVNLGQRELLVWDSDVDRRDTVVRGYCQQTRYGAERFAEENDGEYPLDVNTDQSLAGNTLLELIYSGGEHLENPYSLEKTEPRDGVASTAGEAGYAPITNGGIVTGFSITGFGSTGLLLTVERSD